MADTTILTRLDGLKLKYEEIGQKLTDPEVIADVKQFVQLNKEYKELEPIIETSDRFRTAIANLSEAKDVMANDKDEEMREMAREEIAELEPAIERIGGGNQAAAHTEKTRRIPKTPSSKSAAARAATKRPSLRATCCACTPNTWNRKAGATKSRRSRTAPRAATRKWC